jgi:cephalosporin hydroxylase
MLKLLNRGFAVVAPQSKGRCWADADLELFEAAQKYFFEMSDAGKTLSDKPVYGLGVGSGGDFLLQVASSGAVLSLAGLHLISAKAELATFTTADLKMLPPIAFVSMPLGDSMGTMEKAVALLNDAGVATHVHKAFPQPLTAEGLMSSVPGVDPAASAGIIAALRAKGYLKSRSEFCSDLEKISRPNTSMGMLNASMGVFSHISVGVCKTLNHTESTQDSFLIPYHVEAAWGAIDAACRHGGPLCQDGAVKAAVRGPTAPAIFEELKVCEGVHTATREGLDEALDFLISTGSHPSGARGKLVSRKVSPKKASAGDLEVPSSLLNHKSNHKNGQLPFLAPTVIPTINPPMMSLNTHAMLNGMNPKYIPGDNQWGFPMADSMIKLDGSGVALKYDDIEYGMNHLWEDLGIWTTQTWHGIQFLQNPADAFAIQELLWNEKPDMVVEIGTHKGASALYFAEVMHDYNPDALWVTIDPAFQNSATARAVAAQGPLAKNIVWINGLSNDAVNVVPQVKKLAENKKKVIVIQDGQHAASQVLADFALYDSIVTVGSYFIVQDTILDRTQAPQPGPLAGVNQWLSGYGRGRYVADKRYEHELWSTNHNGYLRKIA